MGRYPRLFDQVRSATRVHRLSYRAEQAYVMWVKQFIQFHDCAHPKDLGPLDIDAFLSHLALDRYVAPSTQNQALSAIVFLYTYVQFSPLACLHSKPSNPDVCYLGLNELTKAVSPTAAKQRQPAIFTKKEAEAVLAELKNPHWLVATLMYGSGLRLMESLRLRVKDIDFHNGTINIRNVKGCKDRIINLPHEALLPLKKQIGLARCIHDEDLSDGYGRTVLPHSLARKYGLASSDFVWQLVFPSGNRSLEPRTGVVSRYHLPEQSVQQAVRSAIIEANIQSKPRGNTIGRGVTNIDKHLSCHTFRHSYATHSLQRGIDIHTVQKQLGHSDASAMQAYVESILRGDTAAAHPLRSA